MEQRRSAVAPAKSYVSSSRVSAPVNTKDDKGRISSSEPEFKYGLTIGLGLFPPLAIIMAFGGRPSLIALCFGFLTAYIFDLVGTIEATVMSIVVTLVAIWATVMWSARMLLNESFKNFGMLFALGLVLVYFFVVLASGFRMLRIEFDSLFYIMEPIIFATLPLISASVLTWLLCIEMPTIDLPACFSCCYFVYLIVFARPRPPSTPLPVRVMTNEDRPICLLSPEALISVYALPVFLSPVLHLALHHNVLALSYDTFVGLATSALTPLLLVILAAENQLGYYAPSARSSIASAYANFKLVASLLLLLCLQSHPMLDDLKGFSGMSEGVASYFLCGAFSFLFLAVYLHRSMWLEVNLRKILITLSIAFAAFLGGCIIGLSQRGQAAAVAGAVAIAEFYDQSSQHLASIKRGISTGISSTDLLGSSGSSGKGGRQLLQAACAKIGDFVLLLLACWATGIVLESFVGKTLWPLSVSFTFLGVYNVPIKFFCLVSLALSVMAVAGPATAVRIKIKLEAEQYTMSSSLPALRPGTKTTDIFSVWNTIDSAVKDGFFTAVIALFSLTVAAAELMVREHDWQDHGVVVGAVYPSFLMAASAIALVITSIHLVNVDVLSISGAWCVSAVQLCKLLHVFGLPSEMILSLLIILLSYSLPFALHSRTIEEINETGSIWEPKVDSLQLLSYAILTFLASRSAMDHVAPIVLARFILSEPSDIQTTAAVASVWFAYLAALCLAFWREAAGLRSGLLLVSGVSALVAAEAIGPLSLALDPSSSTYLVVSLHPEMAQGDHSGLFLLVATLLVITALLGVFPIQKPLPRVLFALALCYSGAHALMGLGFPASMAADSPHSGTFHIPWVYSLLTAGVTVSTSLRAMASLTVHAKAKARRLGAANNSTGQQSEPIAGNAVILLCLSLPFLAVGWAFLEDSMAEHLMGILWVATSGFAAVCVSVKGKSVLLEYFPPALSVDSAGGEPSAAGRAGLDQGSSALSPLASAVATVTGLAGCLSGTMASLISPHIYNDIAVPLSSLLLICTTQGIVPSMAASSSSTSASSSADYLSSFHLAAAYSSLWWMFSAFYSVVCKGWNGLEGIDLFYSGGRHGEVYGDSDVSIWTSESKWLAWANLLLLLVPLPAIVLSTVMRRRSETEDMMFILAVASVLPVIGAGLWSIRLLGLAGVILATMRCNDIGYRQLSSNRAI